MPTRVTPFLGGTGQDNRGKINVHPTLQRLSVGSDVLASANLHTFGNAYVTDSLVVGIGLPALNVFAILGNAYIAGNLYMGRTSFVSGPPGFTFTHNDGGSDAVFKMSTTESVRLRQTSGNVSIGGGTYNSKLGVTGNAFATSGWETTGNVASLSFKDTLANSVTSTNVISSIAKAWVNFKGTGTVTVREEINVSSITDNGQGDWTVVFRKAMNTNTYAVIGSGSPDVNGAGTIVQVNAKSGTPWVVAPNTTACQITTGNTTVNKDLETVCVAFFNKGS